MSNPFDFPIPYPGQLPNDDLATARLLLNAVAFSMEKDKDLAASEVRSLFNVLCAAMTKLEVIDLFLQEVDCPDLEKQYQAARRLWIIQKGGAR